MAKSGTLLLSMLLCFTPVRMKLIIEGCLGAVVGTLGGAALLGSLVAYVARCSFTECCKGRWIGANITGLQPALRRRACLDRGSLLAEVSHDEAKMRARRERPLLAGKDRGRYKSRTGSTRTASPGRINSDRLGPTRIE